MVLNYNMALLTYSAITIGSQSIPRYETAYYLVFTFEFFVLYFIVG